MLKKLQTLLLFSLTIFLVACFTKPDVVETEPAPPVSVEATATASPTETATAKVKETATAESMGRCAPTDINQVDQIVVGATVPLSEPGAVTGGIVMQAAFNMALEEINQAGGILGKSLRLITLDTAGTPERGTVAAEQLVMEECVVAIVGEYHSAVALNMMEVAHNYHIPTIFAETYNDKITAKGYPEVFRIAPTSSLTAQMDARWLSEVGDYGDDGELFAVIVAENTDFGTGQVEKAETWFPEFDIEMAVFLVDVPTRDFSAVIDGIQALDKRPDAIFIKVTGETSFTLQQQLAEAEMGPDAETIVVANQVALNHEIYWQQVPDGAFTVVPRIGPWGVTVNETGLAFAQQYQVFFDRWPEAYAFEAYDSLYIMADAIERAGSIDPDAIITALEETDIELAAGRYHFPYGMNSPLEAETPAYMWHQWPDVPLLFVQYTKANQHSSDVAVIWPDTYRTTEGPIIRPK